MLPFDVHHRRGSELTADEHRALLAAAVDGMPDMRLAALVRQQPRLLADCDHLVSAAEPGGKFAGLAAARWVGSGEFCFLQLAITLIEPRHRRGPLLLTLWRVLFEHLVAGERGFPSVIALRTFNPSAFQAMRVFARVPGVNVYPRIDGIGQDVAMVRIARRIAAELNRGCAFDPMTGVLPGAGVPKELYTLRPDGGSQALQRYFAAHLRDGDRLLCVLSAAEPAARARICRVFGLSLQGPAMEDGNDRADQ